MTTDRFPEETALIERAEVDSVPEADPIRVAVAGLISAVMAAMPDSPARVAVIGEIIEVHARLAALLNRRASRQHRIFRTNSFISILGSTSFCVWRAFRSCRKLRARPSSQSRS
jgi:hypothetical protein